MPARTTSRVRDAPIVANINVSGAAVRSSGGGAGANTAIQRTNVSQRTSATQRTLAIQRTTNLARATVAIASHRLAIGNSVDRDGREDSNNHAALEASCEFSSSVSDQPLRCQGCVEGASAQLAHMDLNGCLCPDAE
jgi:predicted nucleic acid-binding Zn ribbon protein